ncbi:glycosyltransferase family 2 protein [Yonghaparkia sp. Root332]|uniref:glycosyltransferase family 2 protein n=1 Tax=Yonghaparkia sp. Root332 TaxID=1736516 RepID=UPI00138EDA18|nr:glycosyltransferase family 2 protein [Yonghaparkia sp. Root332]
MIPHYNNPRALLRAVESVRGQTLPPSGIVIVDDASTTSESHAMLDDLEADPRGGIQVLRFHRNRGPSAARNAGWDRLDTDYVAFLDSDDTWDRRKLEVQIAAMRDGSAEVSAHRCEVIGSRGGKRDLAPERPITRVRTRDLLFKSRFSTPSVIVTSKVVERFPEDMRYCEDLDLWLRLAASYDGILLLPQTLGYLHKAAFGAAGLSADLEAMEEGQRVALRRCRERGDVTESTYRLAVLFGRIRYVRRIALARVRGRAQRSPRNAR